MSASTFFQPFSTMGDDKLYILVLDVVENIKNHVALLMYYSFYGYWKQNSLKKSPVIVGATAKTRI